MYMNKEGNNTERCCGTCCWFYGEDTYGFGGCPFEFAEVKNCSDVCPRKEYVSREQMRKHQSVLLRFNRYRRDDEGIYRCPDPIAIGKAIDFAAQYMKIFSNL